MDCILGDSVSTDVSSLRQLLYSALDDTDSLPDVLQNIAEAFGGTGAFFNMLGGSIDKPLFNDMIAVGIDFERAAQVERELGVPDPWSAAYIKKYGSTFGRVAIGTHLCTDEEIQSSVWVPYIEETGLCDVMITTFGLRVRSEPEPRRAVLTLHRSHPSQPFNENDQHLMEQLLPDIKRVASVIYTMREATYQTILLEEALEDVPEGILILNEYEVPVFKNEAAVKFLLKNNTNDRSNNIVFHKAVKDAVTSSFNKTIESHEDLSVEIPRKDNQPLFVRIMELNSNQGSQFSRSPRHILIMASDPSLERAINPEELQSANGLSRSESEVSALLFDGLTTEEIAEERGVSIETIRSQIKSVMFKTGTKTRAALISKLSLASRPLVNKKR